MAATRKTLSLPALLSLRDEARAAGRAVVHCHGCFDIVHPGHIRHLQEARSLGDLLVVSVSADAHVNKGAARPLIPEELRADSLAALECVDAVYINRDPTAVELLGQLRPDVYVKGREYEKSTDPRFLAERDAVEAAGGRVVYSSGDVVYSSSALIGKLPKHDAFNDDKVARFRDRYGLTPTVLDGLLRRGRGRRIVVVGDYLVDRYHFCTPTGVAAEAPMMTLRSLQQRDYDGGAGIVAMHLAAMGAAPALVCAWADDAESSQAELRLAGGGVELHAPRVRRETPRKHRFLADQTKLFKVDEGGAAPADSRVEQAIADCVLAAADGAAAVVFADFGYGVVSTGLLERVLPALRERVPVLAADTSGRHASLGRFKHVDLLCPSEQQLRQAQNDFASGLGALAWNLLEQTGARHAIVTLGKQGLVTFGRNEQDPRQRLCSEHLPALATDATDTLGCGDALLAAATLALAAGGSLEAAAFLGAIAAALEAREIGNIPIRADQLRARLGQTASMSAAA